MPDNMQSFVSLWNAALARVVVAAAAATVINSITLLTNNFLESTENKTTKVGNP